MEHTNKYTPAETPVSVGTENINSVYEKLKRIAWLFTNNWINRVYPCHLCPKPDRLCENELNFKQIKLYL